VKRGTYRPRCKGHEIASSVREETENAPRFPASQSEFLIKPAREWRFSMAGIARRSFGPHNRDPAALVVAKLLPHLRNPLSRHLQTRSRVESRGMAA
jgi:hypothetical protein